MREDGPPGLSSEIVREVLLGRHGPLGDPRAAVDALDDVEVLVAGLDVEGAVHLAGTLVDLLDDADGSVATGAVLALDVVRQQVPATADRSVDVVGRMIDLALTGGSSLDRPPTGFASAAQQTLRAELAVVAAGSATAVAIPAVDELVERAPAIGVARVDLVAALTARLPGLVVARAHEWVGPTDSAVVARLRDHHRRIAVATAVRPWDEAAIRAIELAGRWQRWHEAETEAVLRVMHDDAPELTAPSGVGEVVLDGRWWIVAERLWDWTLWRREDGRAVLEQVEGGVGMWTSIRAVPDDVASAIIAAAAAGDEPTGREIAAELAPEA